MGNFLKMEVSGFDKIFADLPRVTKAATADALNFTARKVNKNVRGEISSVYNVPKAATKFGNLVSLKRANARNDTGAASIFIRRKGRGLIKYGARQTKDGLIVKVKRSSKKIPHGFISPLHKGGSDKFAFIKATGKLKGKVTRRTKKGTPYQADKRAILWGPIISDLYTNNRAGKVIVGTIDDEFQKELDKQFSKRFEKGR